MKYTVFWRYMVDWAEELYSLALFYDVSDKAHSFHFLQYCKKRLDRATYKRHMNNIRENQKIMDFALYLLQREEEQRNTKELFNGD